MEFKKYQHIERLDCVETQGIEDGICYIFPKIDGTNGSIWWDDWLKAGSRNRELTLDNDNQGFCAWVLQQENLVKFFKDHSNIRLFGEWMRPHTLRTYRDEVWNRFWVFDVLDDDGYFGYEGYKRLLEDYSIDFIPLLAKVENPSLERLHSYLEKNTFMIKDNEGLGEGIVIKNYDYLNKFGRMTWAKVVRNEFKEKSGRNSRIQTQSDKLSVEEQIAREYITKTLVDKEYAKIIADEDGWSSKYIPRLLGTIYYCLIKEESWNFIKKYKNPVIDYKQLIRFTNIVIKEHKSELF